MSDPGALLALGSTLTMGIGVIAVAGLKAWHEWLDLKRERIASGRQRAAPRNGELAELRDRVKRLEAIANG